MLIFCTLMFLVFRHGSVNSLEWRPFASQYNSCWFNGIMILVMHKYFALYQKKVYILGLQVTHFTLLQVNRALQQSYSMFLFFTFMCMRSNSDTCIIMIIKFLIRSKIALQNRYYIVIRSWLLNNIHFIYYISCMCHKKN